MRRDRARALATAAFATAALAGCTEDAGPRLTPAELPATAQATPLLLAGLPPTRYLTERGGAVALVADFTATIGGSATTVGRVDGAGLEVTLASHLPVGVHPLTVRADGATWTTPAALTITAVPCPAAPDDCTAFRCGDAPSCYYVCSAKVWPAAASLCSTRGLGCLATIDDAAENDCVTAATAPAFPDLIWLGWRQAAGAVEPAGGWAWECPNASSYLAPNWGGVEPNDEGGDEDCGALGSGGAWIDGACTTALRYVCEL